MSLRESLGNLRTDAKIMRERANAEFKAFPFKSALALPMMFAGAFVAMLVSLAVPGASAAIDLNSTIGPLIDGITALAPSFISLIVGYFPLMVLGALLSFIVGLIGRILGYF